MIRTTRKGGGATWLLVVTCALFYGCTPQETVATRELLEEPPAGPAAETAEVAAARTVLDAFMSAFSARDVDGFEGTFHFPHVRLASGTVTVLEAAGTRPDMFERFQEANPEWHHSDWISRELISTAADKVHFNTVFARYREDGSEIARYGSIYIVERIDGRWGIRARSSFAP